MTASESHAQRKSISDQECQLWAGQLMIDVKDYVAKEEQGEKEFIRAWFSWKELVRGLNLIDLRLYSENEAARESRILNLHESLVSEAISLGIEIKRRSESMDPKVLDLASFSEGSLDSMMHSIEDSNSDFHAPKNSDLEEKLLNLLSA